jgi:hypothetical protein
LSCDQGYKKNASVVFVVDPQKNQEKKYMLIYA